MKFSIWIDTKFIRYAWYRKWQAKRARNRLIKEAEACAHEEVQTYQPSSSAYEKEQERYKRVLAIRAAKDTNYIKDYNEAYQAAKLNPEYTEKIFTRNKVDYPTYTMERAFDFHCNELLEAIQNDRYTKKD